MKEKEMTDKTHESKETLQKTNTQQSEARRNTDSSQPSEENLSCNTFIEYFYVFGPHELTMRREDFYITSRFTKPGYLRMQLLSKFPPFEKPISNIDENVIMSHCFPSGFDLFVMKNENDYPKNESFHFSLNNLNSLGYDDKRIYFTCLKFYEPLTTYYEMLIRIKKHSKTNSGKLKPLSSNLKKLIEKYYIPKVICLSSFVPFPKEEKHLLNKILIYVKGLTEGIQNNLIVPIEKVIEKLVLGIPRPPKGKFYITYKNNNCIIPKTENDYEIKQREINQYNFYSYKMHLIFMFKIEDIFEIIKCLLLEVPILFFSQNKDKLTNVFETFIFLLSPFEYQYPHVSILPDINAGIIEMAKSFAFGINYEYVDEDNKEGKKTYFEKLNINVFNKLIKIVDIDHRKITYYLKQNPTQKITTFHKLGNNYIKEDFIDNNYDLSQIELPAHFTNKFKKRLSEFLENNKMKTSDCNMDLNRKIGEDIFYYFLCCIFQNYNKYLYNTEEETKKICKEIMEKNNVDEIPIDHLCKTGPFLKEFKDDYFLSRFFNTKIFRNFLIRKYLNNDVDKFTFLHFDETILSKRNRSFFKRKIKTEFLDSKILQATHCYGVDSTKNFSQEEYSYISSHLDDLVNYYQRFNGVLFTYYLFPKLIYDNKYFKQSYIPPKFFDKFLYQQMQNYQKSLETLEQPKYFRIYDGDLVVRRLYNCKNDLIDGEIENDVLLLWLRVFCLTFYYCDKNEKIIRFVEMLENMKKAKYVRNDILSLLLITLKKHGDEFMTIKLFERFKRLNYNEFAYLANKLYNPLKKDIPQIKQLSIANAKLNINYFKEKDDNIKIFDMKIKNIDYIMRHRTFWGDGIQGKSEKIKFDNPICPECKKANSLKKLLTNYEKMNKDMNLSCIHCNKKVSFNVTVKIGYKTNGEETTFNIYNPYYLYNTMSTQLIKFYGNKINLSDLRNLYKDFFWNCILNFKIAGLSCDMMLKYNKFYKVKVKVELKKELVTEKKKGKGDKDKDKNKINKFNDLQIVKSIDMII